MKYKYITLCYLPDTNTFVRLFLAPKQGCIEFRENIYDKKVAEVEDRKARKRYRLFSNPHNALREYARISCSPVKRLRDICDELCVELDPLKT
jgi:hypothetical protein